jgi:hypothetical protein
MNLTQSQLKVYGYMNPFSLLNSRLDINATQMMTYGLLFIPSCVFHIIAYELGFDLIDSGF